MQILFLMQIKTCAFFLIVDMHLDTNRSKSSTLKLNLHILSFQI